MTTAPWDTKVPEDRIRNLAERIKPVVRFVETPSGLQRFDAGFLYYIKEPDLFNESYLWNVTPSYRAPDFAMLTDINAYHAYSHPLLFKPSIAEVLATVPAKYAETAVAFELIWRPDSPEYNKPWYAAGYHRSRVRLFTKE